MDRTTRVRLEAAVQGYISDLQRAKAATREWGREVSHTARVSKQDMQTVGTAAAVMGGAITGAMVLAGKASIDFESSFAGVRKTVNATEPEFARLAAGMRNMARSIPTNVNELNAIGESAGQLGIQTDNLLGFTRVMADLGETTNLSSDEAATSLARLANITQMPQTQFDRLGSTIVALGNNFATTESEIVEMGQRIAGAGAQIGLSEPQILATSAALSSLGINAEAGGTAISKVMIDIASHVANGSDDLATFAGVAGMTAQEFTTAWEQDASAALGAFVTGLGDMEARGGSTLQVLEQLGITEVRMRDALLRASGAGELWADAGDLANQAWEENTALADEAAQRYGTVESRIQLARNAMNDAAITIGQTFTPAVGGAADVAAALFRGIADMPAPLAGATAGLGAVGGAAGLAAGGFLIAAPRIVETMDALDKLSGKMPRTVGALRGMGSFVAGPWGVAIGAGIGLLTLWGAEQQAVAEGAERLRTELERTAGSVEEGTAAWIEQELRGRDVVRFLADYGVSLEDVQAAVTGTGEEFRIFWDKIGANQGTPLDSLAHILPGVRDHTTDLANAVRIAREQYQLHRDNLVAVEGRYMDLQHALESGLTPAEASARIQMQALREMQDETGGSADDLGTSFDDLTGDIGETNNELEAYLDTLAKATDPVYALNSALGDVKDAQEAYNEAVEKHGAGSEEARQALWDLSEAVAAAEAAAIDGDLSFEAFETKLRQWVSAGHLTREQAEVIRERVAALRGEAESYAGSYLATLGLSGYGSTMEQLRNIAEAADRAGRDIHVNVSGTTIGGRTQHGGGWAGSGPRHDGNLRPGEVPMVGEVGEFVVRKEMAAKHASTLQAINAGALRGVPIFHDGGTVGGSGSIRQQIVALDTREQARQQQLRRGGLVDAIESARADFDGSAEAAERLAQAIRDLQEFDRERVVTAEKARLETELEIATNREQFEFSRMSTREQIESLTRRMHAERRFTEEWMSLSQQRAQLLDEETERRQQEAKDAVARLNEMLDARARILKEREQLEERHAKRVEAIRRSLREDIGGLVSGRRDELSGDLPFTAGVGYSAGSITDTLRRQTDDLRTWAAELDRLRGRGVSNRVVEMLGLDQGPEALQQIRQLQRATDDELAGLDAAAAQHARRVRRTVTLEQQDPSSQLARDIAATTRDHNAQIREAQREFRADQAALTRELRQIGRDQGRTLSRALTEGLKSGMPALRAQVREVKELLAQATPAAVTGAVTAGRVTSARAAAGGIDAALLRELAKAGSRSVTVNAQTNASASDIVEDAVWALQAGG